MFKVELLFPTTLWFWGFWGSLAPHLLGKYIIPDSIVSPILHRIVRHSLPLRQPSIMPQHSCRPSGCLMFDTKKWIRKTQRAGRPPDKQKCTSVSQNPIPLCPRIPTSVWDLTISGYQNMSSFPVTSGSIERNRLKNCLLSSPFKGIQYICLKGNQKAISSLKGKHQNVWATIHRCKFSQQKQSNQRHFDQHMFGNRSPENTDNTDLQLQHRF